LVVINKSAVRRLERLPPASGSHLPRRSSFGGRFPHLPCSSAIGTEVDPAAISGPARADFLGGFRCYPPQLASLSADDVNIPLPSRGDGRRVSVFHTCQAFRR